MLLRAVLCASLMLAPAPAEQSKLTLKQLPQVKRVWCNGAAGTAFVAGGHLVTVRHVAQIGNCHIGSDPLNVKSDEILDFAVGDATERGLEIDCGGFRKGHKYYSVGFALSEGYQTIIELTATGDYAQNGEAILWGAPAIIPGMSGGPVISDEGKVVGLNNMFMSQYPISLSQELKTTSLCS
jgi:hypothetical protein